jgi:hypothetical protein
MTEANLLLNQPSPKVGYQGIRSVAPASLNALIESDGHDGFNSASNGQPSPRQIADISAVFCAGRSAFQNHQTSRGTMDAAIQALVEQSVRERLEAAAKTIETRAGNVLYVKAWRIAAKIVREQKPN